MLLSLDSLSIGDAFGEVFFQVFPNLNKASELLSGPWMWTDDTQMALSIVKILKLHGRIEQDALAQAFAQRYEDKPNRGYARGAASLLRQVAAGADWR